MSSLGKFRFITFAFLLLVFPVSSFAQKFPLPIVPQGFGFNIHFVEPKDGEMEMLAASGVRWIRMDFTWEATEKEKGVYDFYHYERLLNAMEPYGLRALFILDYGNPLYDQGLSPHTDEARQAFARWAVAAAKHFSGRGILWEIWNEPNGDMFWKPKENPEDYIQLALTVGKLFQKEVPKEILIGPALSRTKFGFLKKCFRAGLLQYWDGVSIHPYRQKNPETANRSFRRLKKLIARYAPEGKNIPILSGEWGYSSVPSEFSEATQASYLARMWLNNLYNNIPLSIWYDWHDDGPDPHEREHHFGVVQFPYHGGRQPPYDPKPAYQAAQTLNSILNGYIFERRLALGKSKDYFLLFRKGEDYRIAFWTSAKRSREVKVPLKAGTYQLIGLTGEKLKAWQNISPTLRLHPRSEVQYLLPEKNILPALQKIPTRI